jgi:hypothetical protein
LYAGNERGGSKSGGDKIISFPLRWFKDWVGPSELVGRYAFFLLSFRLKLFGALGLV